MQRRRVRHSKRTGREAGHPLVLLRKDHEGQRFRGSHQQLPAQIPASPTSRGPEPVPGGLGSGGTALLSLPSTPSALQGRVPVISDCPSISMPGLWVRFVSTEQRTGGVCTSPGRSSATSGDTSPRSISAFWDTGIHGLDLPSLRICVVIWLPGCFLSLRKKHGQFWVLLLPLSC